MTLFNPSDLKAVFPEATPDTLTDPNLAPYHELATRYLATQESAGRLAMTGGSHDALGDLLDPDDPDRLGDPLLNLDPAFRSSLEQAHQTASQLFGLANETPPSLKDPVFREQFARLQPRWKQLESLGLEPELSISFEHQPLDWWLDLSKALAESNLNPDEPNPEYGPRNPAASPTRKVLRNGGLLLADEVKGGWQQITNPDNLPPTWTLSIISATERPNITNVTSYGYTDQNNEQPSAELNQRLAELGLPPVPDRQPAAAPGSSGGLFVSRRPAPATPATPLPLEQPAIHPATEVYITTQFSRIIQHQKPLDSETWSWLKGGLPSGRLPNGYWRPVGGQVRLFWDAAGSLVGSLGVRLWLSGRG